MPELPEVETVKRTLQRLIVGKTVEDVDVFLPKIIKEPSDVNLFVERLRGRKVTGLGRRGKFLKIFFDPWVLVSHMRMEGRYRLLPREEPLEKHTHVVFRFTDGTDLRYRDVRQFGTMHLFRAGRRTHPPLNKLGPEPLSEEFTSGTIPQEALRQNHPAEGPSPQSGVSERFGKHLRGRSAV